MSGVSELERQFYAAQREIAFIRQALGISETADIFKAIDDLAERSELERAVVEASVVYFDCQIDMFYVDWCDAVERLKTARAAQAVTA